MTPKKLQLAPMMGVRLTKPTRKKIYTEAKKARMSTATYLRFFVETTVEKYGFPKITQEVIYE